MSDGSQSKSKLTANYVMQIKAKANNATELQPTVTKIIIVLSVPDSLSMLSGQPKVVNNYIITYTELTEAS